MAIPMLAAGALLGLGKSVMEAPQRRMQLENEITKQKYSPWLGGGGDLGRVQQNNTFSNVSQGAMGGFLQDQATAQAGGAPGFSFGSLYGKKSPSSRISNDDMMRP